MAIERTFSIVKPDAVAKNYIGQIYNRFETAGLKIVASKMMHLSQEKAEGFYAEHSERPFFGALVEFMTSGPVFVQTAVLGRCSDDRCLWSDRSFLHQGNKQTEFQ